MTQKVARDTPSSEQPLRPASAALRLVATYAVFSFLWILFSDNAVGYFLRDPDLIVLASTLKGWFFVATTSLLLYLLAHRLFLQIQSYAGREQQARTESLRSHRLLACLADCSSDVIFAKDLQGRYMLFNREAGRITGQDAKSMIGRGDAALFAADHADRILASDRDVIASNRISTYEETLPTPTGERTFLTTKGPLRDEDDRIIGVFGISRDITERKQAEDVVRKNAANLRKLFEDNTSVMLLLEQATGNIIEANESAVRFYGYPRSQLERMRIDEINMLPPEQIVMARQIAGVQERPVFHFPHRLASGEIRDVEVHTTPIEREGRALLLSIIHDITLRKQTERSLRESEERLRLAMDASSQGWFDLDLSTGEIKVSPEYARLIGYEPDELKSNLDNWLENIHPDDRDVVAQSIQTCTEEGGACSMEYRRRTKSGDWLWIRSVGKIVAWDAGHKARRLIGIHTDITERKEMEDQIRQLAFFDPLTRLPNRRLLNDRLSRAMATSKRSGRYAAVMFADLDNFKPLNDLHGHEVGDLLLIEVAERLRNCVREMDTVARIGGDEFVIMICELDADKAESAAQAAAVAEKIRVALSRPYILTVQADERTVKTVEHHCSGSIGVTLFIDHSTSQGDILKHADQAMYQAKEAGRDKIRFFEETPAGQGTPPAGP